MTWEGLRQKRHTTSQVNSGFFGDPTVCANFLTQLFDLFRGTWSVIVDTFGNMDASSTLLFSIVLLTYVYGIVIMQC